MNSKEGSIISNLLRLGPVLILFISVLNEIDLNYIKFFSFNFTFILVFTGVLEGPKV